MIRFLCPQGHQLSTKVEAAGKPGKCPTCGAKFLIPTAAEAQKALNALRQSTIVFLCPNGHRLNGPSDLQGKAGQCPHCNAKFRIPVYDDEQPVEETSGSDSEILENVTEIDQFEAPEFTPPTFEPPRFESTSTSSGYRPSASSSLFDDGDEDGDDLVHGDDNDWEQPARRTPAVAADPIEELDFDDVGEPSIFQRPKASPGSVVASPTKATESERSSSSSVTWSTEVSPGSSGKDSTSSLPTAASLGDSAIVQSSPPGQAMSQLFTHIWGEPGTRDVAIYLSDGRALHPQEFLENLSSAEIGVFSLSCEKGLTVTAIVWSAVVQIERRQLKQLPEAVQQDSSS
ncbi:hypothetical protein [Lignipirellula cremea]|uniref:hypothetical protein n=1 Tax=Lignipirellula cremea TaxID=2528010 RepID=UPI0011A3716F|nr:hypothetical protein [Lignipirellula cremea]